MAKRLRLPVYFFKKKANKIRHQVHTHTHKQRRRRRVFTRGKAYLRSWHKLYNMEKAVRPMIFKPSKLHVTRMSCHQRHPNPYNLDSFHISRILMTCLVQIRVTNRHSISQFLCAECVGNKLIVNVMTLNGL